MGLTRSPTYQHFTYLENAGYKRNKKSQNISDFLMGNLKQMRNTRKDYSDERKHEDAEHFAPHSVWHS